jgi:hypothetical protein
MGSQTMLPFAFQGVGAVGKKRNHRGGTPFQSRASLDGYDSGGGARQRRTTGPDPAASPVRKARRAVSAERDIRDK